MRGGSDLTVGSPVQYRVANDSGLVYPALIARILPDAWGDGEDAYDVVFFVVTDDVAHVEAVAARTKLGEGPGTIGLVSVG